MVNGQMLQQIVYTGCVHLLFNCTDFTPKNTLFVTASAFLPVGANSAAVCMIGRRAKITTRQHSLTHSPKKDKETRQFKLTFSSNQSVHPKKNTAGCFFCTCRAQSPAYTTDSKTKKMIRLHQPTTRNEASG